MITDRDIEKLKAVFATKEDLKNFATKEDLKQFATKEDLHLMEVRMDKKYATKEEINAQFAAFRLEFAKFSTKMSNNFYNFEVKMRLELQNLREDKEITAEYKDHIEDHEKRITTLEHEVRSRPNQ